MTFDWAGIVERDGEALAEAVAVDPAATVPAAREWNTTELLRHVGFIHPRAILVLQTGTMERPTVENLHATDTEGEWLIRFAEGEVAVESGHARGDAAVRGPAGDLLLWMWGRLPFDRLETFGDRGAAEALRSVTTL